MMKKIKILILGIGQSNFLNQLYTGILENSDQFEFYINGYFDLSKGEAEDTKLPYVKFLNLREHYPSKFKQLIFLLSLIKNQFFWAIVFFELSQKFSLSNLKVKLQEHIIAKYYAEEVIENLGIQAVHYHFCTPQNLIFANYINKDIPSIASFWGSDLMRITGVENVFYVRKALLNCSAVSVQTPEMAEMFYCKYGRDFYKKMHILRFNLNPDIFKQIDVFKNNEPEIIKFREKYLFNSNEFIIGIGHNAFEANNHIKIIEAIGNLPQKIKSEITLVMHLSYGGNNKYIELLKNISKKEDILDIRIITSFFGPKEMALLRISTNLMIQMPISDALSGAMTEVLYAGNNVIVGSWLPYGFLRRKGIHFFESESFLELPKLVEQVFMRKDNFAEKNKDNPNVVRDFLFPEITTPKWIQLFQSIFVKRKL